MILFIKKYWKSLFCICAIIYASFAPPSNFKRFPTFEHMDKVVHFFMYLILTMALVYDTHKELKGELIRKFYIMICLIFPITLGGFVEILQENFFPPRSADWIDWYVDIAGVLIGLLVMKILIKITRSKI